MAQFNLNRFVKRQQFKNVGVVVIGLAAVGALGLSLVASNHHKPAKTPDKTQVFTMSFTAQDANNALTAQQMDVDRLKQESRTLKARIEARERYVDALMAQLKKDWDKNTQALQARLEASKVEAPMPRPSLFQAQSVALQGAAPLGMPRLHHVSFRSPPHQVSNQLDPSHYVPSNTSVRAVVLGGADADASVYGQSKNNGVMLFKLLDAGTLPNGQHSRLQGCRVSANSFGDISSERAFATLYRLSCARLGEPILDKEVTGWVFYNGKIGIQGVPVMRDSKIMAWAGVSGALSGIAQAAQYAQSIQEFGSFGATSIVPSSNVGLYAAHGGAAKGAEKLSDYYIKRAEQYHPVIQVGAGNIVTIVFKDGFYLEPDEVTAARQAEKHTAVTGATDSDVPEFNVPPEVLNHIANQPSSGGPVS